MIVHMKCWTKPSGLIISTDYTTSIEVEGLGDDKVVTLFSLSQPLPYCTLILHSRSADKVVLSEFFSAAPAPAPAPARHQYEYEYEYQGQYGIHYQPTHDAHGERFQTKIQTHTFRYTILAGRPSRTQQDPGQLLSPGKCSRTRGLFFRAATLIY